jgi:NADPH-dependent ferric siderophore reductase
VSLVTRLTVRRAQRLSPSFVRVELGGDLRDLGLEGSATYDQRIKLLFPGPTGELARLGQETWWQDFRAVPETARGHMRTYTLRAINGTGPRRSIVVDFVVHPGAHGPGSTWAQDARSGDELIAVLPRRGDGRGGIEWPMQRTGRVLLAGDETAVPAICSILAALPSSAEGAALLEVATRADALTVSAPPRITITWLARNGAPVGSLFTTNVLAALELDDARPRRVNATPSPGSGPPATVRDDGESVWETPTYSAHGEALTSAPPDHATPYLWVAGEAGAVRGLRQKLAHRPRNEMSCMGYWRQGRPMSA